ncbi:MAG: alpha/beta hydrolase [Nocardioidaceae bacterium]
MIAPEPNPAGGLPRLRAIGHPPATPRLQVMLLPGGRVRSTRASSRTQLAYLRLWQLGRRLGPACEGVGISLLRYRVRGWNEPRRDPVRDARSALRQLRAERPGVPVALVGHSMGARVALRLAGEDGVVAVCALAPWVEAGEPTAQLDGRMVVIAHGDRDRRTDPAASGRFAARTGATWLCVPGAGHAMLRRSSRWTALVGELVADAVAVAPRSAGDGAR